MDPVVLCAAVVAGGAPLVLAAVGETLTEKAGLINLSLDGTILLSAMTAFVTAKLTGSLALGFLAAAAVGALVAACVAGASLALSQSQVAVGFVLTLMCRDLAYFLGDPFSRAEGPQVAHLPIPGLAHIPVLGPIFFSHNLVVYAGLALVPFAWWYVYRTRPGLALRAVGEHPEGALSRGIDPRRTQALYAVAGGALCGLAGAAFSLCVKPGWGRPQGAEGMGWIALAIVIFGGWHPVKAALGACLFSFLQVVGIPLQGAFPSVPAQVFQVAPFPLMIFMLALVNLLQRPAVERAAASRAWLRRVIVLLRGEPPRALGAAFRQE